MGFFDLLFHRKPKNSKLAPMLNGYAPIFTQFGTNIYASDVVQQAVKCIVDEIKKLNPVHVRYKNTDPSPASGSNWQDVLDDPNPLMTTTEFLEKITWLLLLNYNAFIIPIYRTWIDGKTGEQRRYYEALYPIKPVQVNFIEDASGRLFTQFMFENGYETTIPYDDVIHVKYNYSINDYMGGDQFGQPNHEALLKTLNLNHQMLQGIAKAMNSSYAINAIVKYNTLIDDGSTEANLKELEQKLNNSQNGFLPLDLKGDVIPFKRDIKLVDSDTLKFIDEKILRNWGVPLDVLKGDYSKETYEAFYQKSLEPIIKALSQAFTKKMFTKRERAFGNRIEFYTEDLVFMTQSQKIEMIGLLAPMGGGYVNEYRAWLGLRPIPELEGKIVQSLNYIDESQAAQYQVGEKVNVDVVDEDKTETEV